MFKFITNKPFWVNAIGVLVVAFALIFIVLQTLGWLTNHGSYLTVPAVKNKSTKEAVALLESKGFDVVITDSLYTDTLPKGTVIKQIPEPNATVKVNRSVYLTVNRYIPPMIVMPQLEGKGFAFAKDILKRHHLLLGDTSFKPDFAKGAVLEQKYKGSRIAAGSKLQWGTKVDLVIAGGLEEENLPVPDVIGMKYEEAKDRLESLGVLISIAPMGNITDTMNAYIVKQSPTHKNDEDEVIYIKSGMVMDIWLSQKNIALSNDDNKKDKNK